MISINKVELAKKITSKENFTIMFYSEYCDKCHDQIENFKKHDINCYSINVDNDEDFFIEWYKLDVMPEVQVYRFGNKIWSKENVLNEADLATVKEYERNNI